MLNNIPKSRILLYIVILSLLPVALAVSHFFSKKNSLQELEATIQLAQNMALEKEQRQSINEAVMHTYRDADHFYIDKHLETLSFLEPEIAALQKIVNNPNFAGDETILRRLDFLKGSGNNMLFSEGSIINYLQFQETIATLVRPIEVNIFDLQNILARIEGQEIGLYSPKPGKPQMIILDFSLEKKQVHEKSEVFDLNMKVLKREFL